MAQMAVALEGAQHFENSIIDAMTGLFNKAYFESKFSSERKQAMQRSNHFALFICDIDNFKRVNDTFGHTAGNLILKNVAHLIKASCRPADIVARYGGDEFCVILPETKEGDALQVAEKIRKAMELLSVKHNHLEIKVTISIGIATLDSANFDTMEDLILCADEHLYEAKEKGRNQTVLKKAA